jgi:serum/glucocorticoid-regulated kinase 2
VQLDEIPPFGWSKESVDFVNRLIQRKPENRLGSNGIEEVKYHPFFAKIDWELLEQRRLKSPFFPDVPLSFT